jgi:hypothetical protein
VSLAWGSLVLVIVLLPGILFFAGTYLPEQFTREAEPRSPLGHLAGAVLLAFLIHGVAYALSGSVCGGSLPCVSIHSLLDVASYDSVSATSAASIDWMLHRYRWWVLAYVTGTSGVGIFLGYCYGKLSAARRIRGLSRHPWVHALKVEGLTYGYVLTHVRHEDRVLMYKGFLRAFGLQQDGRFSYIVLTGVTRFYLELGENGSETSRLETQKVIGGSTPAGVVTPVVAAAPHRRVESLFVIEGEDIANVVFDILELEAKPVPDDELRRIVTEEAAKIGLFLGEHEIDQIVGSSKRSGN